MKDNRSTNEMSTKIIKDAEMTNVEVKHPLQPSKIHINEIYEKIRRMKCSLGFLWDMRRLPDYVSLTFTSTGNIKLYGVDGRAPARLDSTKYYLTHLYDDDKSNILRCYIIDPWPVSSKNWTARYGTIYIPSLDEKPPYQHFDFDKYISELVKLNKQYKAELIRTSKWYISMTDENRRLKNNFNQPNWVKEYEEYELTTDEVEHKRLLKAAESMSTKELKRLFRGAKDE